MARDAAQGGEAAYLFVEAVEIGGVGEVPFDPVLDELDEVIRALADKTWAATRKTERIGRTVVLKLKTDRFRILTRSHTPDVPPASAAELADIALALRERVDLPESTRYRLAGVGLSGFRDPGDVPDQPLLFEQA